MWLVPVIPLSKRLRQNCNFKVRPEMEELRKKKKTRVYIATLLY